MKDEARPASYCAWCLLLTLGTFKVLNMPFSSYAHCVHIAASSRDTVNVAFCRGLAFNKKHAGGIAKILELWGFQMVIDRNNADLRGRPVL